MELKKARFDRVLAQAQDVSNTSQEENCTNDTDTIEALRMELAAEKEAHAICRGKTN